MGRPTQEPDGTTSQAQTQARPEVESDTLHRHGFGTCRDQAPAEIPGGCFDGTTEWYAMKGRFFTKGTWPIYDIASCSPDPAEYPSEEWIKGISQSLMREMDRKLMGLPASSTSSANYTQVEPLTIEKLDEIIGQFKSKPVAQEIWVLELIADYEQVKRFFRKYNLPLWPDFPGMRITFFDRYNATEEEFEILPRDFLGVRSGVYVEMSDGNHFRLNMTTGVDWAKVNILNERA